MQVTSSNYSVRVCSHRMHGAASDELKRGWAVAAPSARARLIVAARRSRLSLPIPSGAVVLLLPLPMGFPG